jgi:hypothetical protein
MIPGFPDFPWICWGSKISSWVSGCPLASAPEQEENSMKWLQVNGLADNLFRRILTVRHVTKLFLFMFIFSLQPSCWQQPDFFGCCCQSTAFDAFALNKRHPILYRRHRRIGTQRKITATHGLRFIKAECNTKDMGSNVEEAIVSPHVVALSYSVTDGFLSLAACIPLKCMRCLPALFKMG